jgi:hypothetical protein
MDMFFQALIEWVAELVERKYGRVAGCLAVLIGTALLVAGVWVAVVLLT